MGFLDRIWPARASGKLFNEANRHWRLAQIALENSDPDRVTDEVLQVVELCQLAIEKHSTNGDAMVLLANGLMNLAIAPWQEPSSELLEMSGSVLAHWYGMPDQYQKYPHTKNSKNVTFVANQLHEKANDAIAVGESNDDFFDWLDRCEDRFGLLVLDARSIRQIESLVRGQTSSTAKNPSSIDDSGSEAHLSLVWAAAVSLISPFAEDGKLPSFLDIVATTRLITLATMTGMYIAQIHPNHMMQVLKNEEEPESFDPSRQNLQRLRRITEELSGESSVIEAMKSEMEIRRSKSDSEADWLVYMALDEIGEEMASRAATVPNEKIISGMLRAIRNGAAYALVVENAQPVEIFCRQLSEVIQIDLNTVTTVSDAILDTYENEFGTLS